MSSVSDRHARAALYVSGFIQSDGISCLGEDSGVFVHQVTARVGRQGRQVRVLPDAIAEVDPVTVVELGPIIVLPPPVRQDRSLTRA